MEVWFDCVREQGMSSILFDGRSCLIVVQFFPSSLLLTHAQSHPFCPSHHLPFHMRPERTQWWVSYQTEEGRGRFDCTREQGMSSIRFGGGPCIIFAKFSPSSLLLTCAQTPPSHQSHYLIFIGSWTACHSCQEGSLPLLRHHHIVWFTTFQGRTRK